MKQLALATFLLLGLWPSATQAQFKTPRCSTHEYMENVLEAQGYIKNPFMMFVSNESGFLIELRLSKKMKGAVAVLATNPKDLESCILATGHSGVVDTSFLPGWGI